MLALCAVTRRQYTRKAGLTGIDEALRLHSHRDLVEAGWELVVTDEAIEAVFLARDRVTGDDRLVSESEYREHYSCNALGLVVPDWPPGEDRERLTPSILRLINTAQELESEFRKRFPSNPLPLVVPDRPPDEDRERLAPSILPLIKTAQDLVGEPP